MLGQEIDSVIAQVNAMAALVQDAGFNVWDKANAEHWGEVLGAFRSADERVKDTTREVINACFR